MSCCRNRDGFFFHFSEDAPQGYRDELEAIVKDYDGFTDTKTYTPYVTGAVTLVVAAVQAGLGSPSIVFNVLLMLIPAAQVGISALADAGINRSATKANNLINTGEQNKFFKGTPDKLPTTEEKKEETLINMNRPSVNIDAIKYNILGMRR